MSLAAHHVQPAGEEAAVAAWRGSPEAFEQDKQDIHVDPVQ